VGRLSLSATRLPPVAV